MLAAIHIPNSPPDALQRICNICISFSPVVEPIPPDMILLDLTGCGLLDPSLLTEKVAKESQVSTYMGLAATRWVARCAAAHLRLTTQNAWQIVPRGHEAAFLAPLSVGYLVESEIDASKLIKRLMDLGIPTFGELATVTPRELTAQFGTRNGPLLHRLARGKDSRIIRSLYPPERVVFFFRTTPDNSGIVNGQAVDQILRHLSSELATVLAHRGRAARKVSLKITWHDGFSQPSSVLAEPAFSRDALLFTARRLWTIASVTKPVLALELYGENLELPPLKQASVFDPRNKMNKELAHTVQAVKDRFGPQALQTARQLPLTRREMVRAMWQRDHL